MPQARKATAADVDAIAQLIARAFDDDPFWRWMLPAKNFRDRQLRLVKLELHHLYLGNDEVWVTDGEILGAAMWAPPRKWKQPTGEMVRALPGQARVFGRRSLTMLKIGGLIEKAHPPGPHYYLGILGSDPDQRGKGIGSACIEPVLERCDAEGLGAYLESSKEENIAFYNRHGFELTRRLDFPAGAPPLWAMWREPR